MVRSIRDLDRTDVCRLRTPGPSNPRKIKVPINQDNQRGGGRVGAEKASVSVSVDAKTLRADKRHFPASGPPAVGRIGNLVESYECRMAHDSTRVPHPL